MRILVVEDNVVLGHHLAVQLREATHQVDVAKNSQEADYFLQEFPPDIAIIDLGLPGEDGISLIQRWRAEQVKQPILVLTARNSWQEKVTVLGAGADDYVTKPFQFEEVMARILALIRRSNGVACELIEIPPFTLDLSRRELAIHQNPIKLTAFEYTIIETLIRNAGKVVSKDAMMLQLYSGTELHSTHTIDVLMGRLRKKLQTTYHKEVIHTVRGQGYLFDIYISNDK